MEQTKEIIIKNPSKENRRIIEAYASSLPYLMVASSGNRDRKIVLGPQMILSEQKWDGILKFLTDLGVITNRIVTDFISDTHTVTTFVHNDVNTTAKCGFMSRTQGRVGPLLYCTDYASRIINESLRKGIALNFCPICGADIQRAPLPFEWATPVQDGMYINHGLNLPFERLDTEITVLEISADIKLLPIEGSLNNVEVYVKHCNPRINVVIKEKK